MAILGQKLRLSRRLLVRILLALLLLSLMLFGVGWMLWMPGRSFRSGRLPGLTPGEAMLSKWLRRDIESLAAEIGERNVTRYDKLKQAEEYLTRTLEEDGYRVERQEYRAQGKTVSNLEVSFPGCVSPDEIVVVGAHYDTVSGSPGANDNGSGVAALLALARIYGTNHEEGKMRALPPRLVSLGFERTLRFVFFVNEEPPFFLGPEMGSRVYAKHCHETNQKIVAMLCLETMGYFTDAKASQSYPSAALQAVYPSQGNFIAFTGNLGSNALVRQSIEIFRKTASIPSYGAALPGNLPGVGWSDHASFWEYDYPAIMITDTAPFRYPHYHSAQDTPDKIDYDRLARVVYGVRYVVDKLVNPVPE